MEAIGIVGVIAAVAAVIYLIWKNWHLALVSLAGAAIVIIFNGMDPFATLSDNFLPAAASFIESWFLLFMLGSIFGKVMGDSGASSGIAASLLKALGDKSVILVVMITGLVLSYGGISTFIIAFSLYPIAVALFRKADIPKKLIVATIMVCPVTVAMVMLPGSPSTQNLLPTKFLGTDAYAGATLGIICSVVMFLAAYLYLNRQVHLARKNGEHFIASEGEDIEDLNDAEKVSLPVWQCYAPIVVLLGATFIILNFTSLDSAYAVACSMTLAIAVGCLLYHKHLDIHKALSDGAGGGLGSIIAISSIMGFGGVVSASPAYASIISGLTNLNVGPLGTAFITINVISAIMGSSLGGLNIFFTNLGSGLLTTGLNLSMLHRVLAIASAGASAMPHASGMVVANQISRMSQRDTYKYVFITCVLFPILVSFLALVLGMMGIV